MIHPGPRAGDYAVATHGLSKRYGRASALDRVDLRVPDRTPSAELDMVGLANASGRLLRRLVDARFGLYARLTARVESSAIPIPRATSRLSAPTPAPLYLSGHRHVATP